MHNFAVIAQKNRLETDLFSVHSNGSIWHQHKRANGSDREVLVADAGTVDNKGNIAAVARDDKINVFWINQFGVLCTRYLNGINGPWGKPYNVSSILVAKADRHSSLCAITPNEKQIYVFWVDEAGAIWVSDWNYDRAPHWKASKIMEPHEEVEKTVGSSLAAVARGNKINVFWINRGGSLCSSLLVDINKGWGAPYDVNGYGYSLLLMSENAALEKNRLYVKIEKNKLQYNVITPSGKPASGEIKIAELIKKPHKESLTLVDLKPLLPNILKITSKRGHSHVNSVGSTTPADYQAGLCAITANENQMYVFYADIKGLIWVNEYNNRTWKSPISITGPKAVSAGSSLTAVARGNKINVFWINQKGSLCSSFFNGDALNAPWGTPFDVGNTLIATANLDSSLAVTSPTVSNMNVFYTDKVHNIWGNEWILTNNPSEWQPAQLKKRAEIDLPQAVSGGNALHELVRNGHAEELAEKLKKEGGLLEQRDSAGDTPLLIAAHLGFVGIIEILLKQGARLECKTKNGDTVLAVAMAQGHQAVVDYLNQHETVFARDAHDETTLHKAVAVGQLVDVENLLRLGAFVNAQNKAGETPLHLAAKKASDAVSSIDIEKCLVTAGGDVTLVDEKGQTALLTLSNPGTCQHLTTLLIQKRNRLPQPRVNNALELSCLQYVGDFEHREADRKLLDQAFQSLTGKIDGKGISALMNEYLLVYLGHLISLKGHFNRVSHNQQRSFEGFHQHYFLALRGRSLFETMVRIKKDLLTSYPGKKETVLNALNQEVTLVIESLQGFLVRLFIHDKLGEGQAPWAIKAHASNVSAHIASLKPGEQYQHCAGYRGHAVYANFEKRPEPELSERIIYRMDNLGGGSHRHNYTFTSYKHKELGHGKKLLPYALSLPKSDFVQNAVKPAKIVMNILEGRYKNSAEALPLLYELTAGGKLIPQDDLKQWYPWRRIQNVGNCVAKNHQIGMQIRLRVFAPNDSLYHWWREEEPKLLPIKSYLVQAAIAVYNTPDVTASEVGDTNPFCSDAEIANELVKDAKAEGYTDLHLAIVANNVSKVTELVNQGASLSDTTNDGYNAVQLAFVYQVTDIYNYLLNVYESHGLNKNVFSPLSGRYGQSGDPSLFAGQGFVLGQNPPNNNNNNQSERSDNPLRFRLGSDSD